MIKRLFQLACLAIGGVAAWIVAMELGQFFEWQVSYGVAVATLLIVFSALYFPLASPIGDLLSDRATVIMHRGKSIRAGSGLDSIPQAQRQVTCSMCGAPNGPICKACEEEMQRNSRLSMKP
jgi:hypothetical protein